MRWAKRTFPDNLQDRCLWIDSADTVETVELYRDPASTLRQFCGIEVDPAQLLWKEDTDHTRQSICIHLHAAIRIALHFHSFPLSDRHVDGYIGVSRSACWCCQQWLYCYNDYPDLPRRWQLHEPRGLIDPTWALPSTDGDRGVEDDGEEAAAEGHDEDLDNGEDENGEVYVTDGSVIEFINGMMIAWLKMHSREVVKLRPADP